MKSGSLNLLAPSGPAQARAGTAFALHLRDQQWDIVSVTKHVTRQ